MPGTIYVDTNGADSFASGTTDTNSATLGNGSGGASVSGSVVDLSANTPDLSSIPTDGSQAIYIADATNDTSLRKIFWITDKNVGAYTVTVDTAPQGTISNSAWGIGGRYVWPGGSTTDVISYALRPGDTIQFNNTPAARTSGSYITSRADGSTTSGGYIRVIGKAGTRPVLSSTALSNAMISLTHKNWWVENLDMVNTAQTSSNALTMTGSGGCVAKNLKVTGGNLGTSVRGIYGGGGCVVIDCEIIGFTGSGIYHTSGQNLFIGNYIHDCNGHAYQHGGTTGHHGDLIFNIFANNGGFGAHYSGTALAADTSTLAALLNNTIWNNDMGGIMCESEYGMLLLINNIVSNNGDGVSPAGYNFEFGATATPGWDLMGKGWAYYNVFYKASNNIGPNITPDATNLTSDPLFIDLGSPGLDFSIALGSPAKNSAFPSGWQGLTLTPKQDRGAVQS